MQKNALKYILKLKHYSARRETPSHSPLDLSRGVVISFEKTVFVKVIFEKIFYQPSHNVLSRATY